MGDARDKPWTRCAIGLGSNLGDRRAHILGAIESLRESDHIREFRASTLIETEPVGPIEQGPYLNGAAVFETDFTARELLNRLQAIELAHGRDRTREERWGPRTLDLDVLLFGNQTIDEPGLRVPHAHLRERRFVLEPLCEVAPGMAVPPEDARVFELLERLETTRA